MLEITRDTSVNLATLFDRRDSTGYDQRESAVLYDIKEGRGKIDLVENYLNGKTNNDTSYLLTNRETDV